MKTFFQIMIVSCLVLSISFVEAAEKVKVASIFGKTGSGAISNKETIEGIRFAVQELNKQGGLLGKQVEILEFDNQSVALHSKLAAEKAVKAGVIAVFGANWSSNSLAMAPVLQAAQIPMISPGSTNPQVTLVGDYIFRVCFLDSFQGEVMANFAFHDLNAKTAVILVNANSRYSEGLGDFFHQYFLKQGGKIAFEANYLQDTDDFSLYFKKIKLLQPDVVFVPGYTADSCRIIKQAREKGLSVKFLGGDGWDNTMYDYAGSAIHGSFYSGHWHKDSKNKKSRQFIKKYGKLNTARPAMTYDTVFLFADAVCRAGSFEPVKIREALAATRNFNGVTGNITFNENGDPRKPAVILKFDKGTSIYVKTIEP